MAIDISPSGTSERSALRAIPPPRLHWSLVLLITVVTLGLFFYAWMFVQALWAKRIDRSNTTLLLLIAGALITLGEIIVIATDPNNPLIPILRLAATAPLVAANYRLKDALEEYSKNVGGPWLNLNGVMTFFFGPIYLQYHIADVLAFLRDTRTATA